MNTMLVEEPLLMTAHPSQGTARRPSGLTLPRALAGAAIEDLLTVGAARRAGARLVLQRVPATPNRLLIALSAALDGRSHTLDTAIDTLAAGSGNPLEPWRPEIGGP